MDGARPLLRSERIAPYVLYLILVGLIVLPLGYLVYAAVLTDTPLAPRAELTLDNLREVLTRPRYRDALWGSVKLAFAVTTVSVLVGTAMAWLVARTDLPGRKLFSVLLPIPLFLSPLAGAIAWIILGSKNTGLINMLYRRITGAESHLFNVFTFAGLVFTMSLFFIPLAYVMVLEPLRRMDASMEEAAQMAGASLRRATTRITLRLAAPALTSAALLIFVLSAEMFSIPGLIGVGARYRTVPYLIYERTQATPADWPGAAAIGLVLLLLMAVGIWLQARVAHRGDRYVTVTGNPSPPKTISLGRLRWPGVGLIVTYLFLALFLPIGALLYSSLLRVFSTSAPLTDLTLDHWDLVLGNSQFRQAIKNTGLITFIGPTLAVILAFLLTYFWYGTRARLKRSTEALAMSPIAMPGIVFAIGILWAFIKSPLYGTIGLMIVAYVARYLCYPVRSLGSSFVQVDRSLGEAARMSGAGWLRGLFGIALPIHRQSIILAWLVLFIFMIRELNVSIMVYTGKSIVAPVLMWGFMESGSLQGAAVMALLETAAIVGVFWLARALFKVDLTRGAHR